MTTTTRLVPIALAISIAIAGQTAKAQFTTLDPQQVSTSAGVNLSVVVVDPTYTSSVW